MKLTDKQEETVRQYVEAHKLQLETLNEDIIDHLCCVLESELGRGKSFDETLQNAMHELAPQGLKELENQTIYLLNAKRIILMKKLTYSIGLIGAMTLTSGATFKILHLPGANELFMIGYILFLLVFIPLLAFDRFKVTIVRAFSQRLMFILGIASSVILGLAGIFKIMHLQGSNFLLMLGVIIFTAFFLPFLFFNMYKKSVS